MADKIKVIVKRPDELYGHMTNISNTLENMQKIVEGPIETLTMPGYVLILNEEGRIRPDIKYNCKVAGFNLYGTFIVAGILYGPVPGALVGFVADFVGCLFSGYGYNPLFAVPPVLIGLCAGLLRPLLYKKVSYLRILACFAPAVVLGSILWQSYWLSAIYGSHSWLWFLGTRSIQFVITSLVNAAVILGLFKSHVFDTLHLWPPQDFKAEAPRAHQIAREQ